MWLFFAPVKTHGFGIEPKRALVQSQATFSGETEKALCGFFVVQGLHLVLQGKIIEIQSPDPVIQIQRRVIFNQSIQMQIADGSIPGVSKTKTRRPN